MGRSPKRHATCRGAVVTGPGWPGACSRSCRYPGEWPRVFWRGGCGMAGAFVGLLGVTVICSGFRSMAGVYVLIGVVSGAAG